METEELYLMNKVKEDIEKDFLENNDNEGTTFPNL